MAKSADNRFFLKSGCLTMEAIEAYVQNRLPGDVSAFVKRHLQSCELCRNAVEGFSAVPGFSEHENRIAQMKERMYFVDQENKTRVWYRSKTVSYMAMAASILLLAGLFSVYTFILRKEPGLVAEEQKTSETFADSVFKGPQKALIEKDPVADLTEEQDQSKSELLREPRVVEKGIAGLPEISDSMITGGLAEPERPGELRLMAKESALPVPAIDSPGQIPVVSTEPPVEAIAFHDESEKTAGRSVDGARSKQVAPSAAMPEKSISIVPDTRPRFQHELYENFEAYLSRQIRYPDSAIAAKIQGKVLVGCEITIEGKIRNVRILESAHPLLNPEALRVVGASPDWIPAMMNHQPVQATIVVPVEFKLDSTLLEKE